MYTPLTRSPLWTWKKNELVHTPKSFLGPLCNPSLLFVTPTLFLGKYWSVFFTFLRSLYKWNHTVSTLSGCLHSDWSVLYLSVHSFCCWVVFHCKDIRFFIQSTCSSILGLFPRFQVVYIKLLWIWRRSLCMDIRFHFSWTVISRNGMNRSSGDKWFHFLNERPRCVLKWLPFCIPTSNDETSSPAKTWSSLRYSNKCAVGSHYDVWSLLKHLFKSFAHSFKKLGCFLIIEVRGIIIYSGYKSFIRDVNLQIFHPIYGSSSHLLQSSFQRSY